MKLYDPPEGWMYGFPKPYRPKTGESLEDTLRRDGYPEEKMYLAKYTRILHVRQDNHSEVLEKLEDEGSK